MSDDSQLDDPNGPTVTGTWRGTLMMATVIQAIIVAILAVAGERTRRALFAILFFMVYGEARLAAPALPYAIAGGIAVFILVLFRSDADRFVAAVAQTLLIIAAEWVLTWLALAGFLVVSVATGRIQIRM